MRVLLNGIQLNLMEPLENLDISRIKNMDIQNF